MYRAVAYNKKNEPVIFSKKKFLTRRNAEKYGLKKGWLDRKGVYIIRGKKITKKKTR